MSDEQMQRLMVALADRAPEPEQDALRGVRRRLRRRTTLRAGTATTALAGVTAVALVVTGLPDGSRTASSPAPSTAPVALPPLRLSGALTSFSSCDQLLGYLHDQGAAQMTPYGLSPSFATELQVRGNAAPQPAAAAGAGARSAPLPFSPTTVQVGGVDEPDLVKTDGRVVVARDGQLLHVVDASGDQARGTVALPVPADQGLLLVGHDVVALGSGSTFAGKPGMGAATAGVLEQPGNAASVTTASVVDVADPDHPRVVRTLTLSARLVGARVVGGSIRLAVSTDAPQLAWAYPQDDTAGARQRALDVNRLLVRATTLDQWLPTWRSSDGTSGRLSSCDDVTRPVHAPVLGTASLVTLDPAAASPGPAVAVVGGVDGGTVYADGTDAYVTGTRYDATGSVDIHRFDLTDPARARYVASGTLDGRLGGGMLTATQASQALSQSAGVLRVTTSTTDATGQDRTAVTTLATHGDRLVELGHVGDIGQGEQVQAVRYVGDTAYVVTYRQTDPVSVVDLADPARPAVRGVLPVDGVSTTLLPLPGNRLLGIGRRYGCDTCAQPMGAASSTGLQLSLFDASDSAHPRLVAQHVLADRSSLAEQDPHAVLIWTPQRLVALPTDADLQTLDLSHGGLRVGPVVPGLSGGSALRGVVVGRRLLTVTSRGVVVSDLATLHRVRTLPW